MAERLLKCLATCLRIVLNCIMMLTYYTYIRSHCNHPSVHIASVQAESG